MNFLGSFHLCLGTAVSGAAALMAAAVAVTVASRARAFVRATVSTEAEKVRDAQRAVDDATAAMRAAEALLAEKEVQLRDLEHALEVNLAWGRHGATAPALAPGSAAGAAPTHEEDTDVAAR